MKTHAQIARDALDILDRDGWAKGALTMVSGMERYEFLAGVAGSHCIGGAVNLAMSGDDDWLMDACATEFYDHMLKVIKMLFPGEDENEMPWKLFSQSFDRHASIGIIAQWNNNPGTTQDDVRVVLEKIAAG